MQQGGTAQCSAWYCPADGTGMQSGGLAAATQRRPQRCIASTPLRPPLVPGLIRSPVGPQAYHVICLLPGPAEGTKGTFLSTRLLYRLWCERKERRERDAVAVAAADCRKAAKRSKAILML